MTECKDCKQEVSHEGMPTIIINITYNDCRVKEDNSNYIDQVSMDAEE